MNNKGKFNSVVQLACLCSALAPVHGLGQMVYTWTNSIPGADVSAPANWTPNGVPDPSAGGVGDTMQWDGQSVGSVFVVSSTGAQTAVSGGFWGLHIVLTANQTNSVNIRTSLPLSSGLRLADVNIAPGAGPFSLGDGTLNALDLIMGGLAGQTHTFVNNSPNPATINPNVRWRFGGGGVHHFVFDGPGDWVANNYFLNASSSPITITKQGSGTMTWTGATVPNAQGNGIIQGPVVVNDGALFINGSNAAFSTVVYSGVLGGAGTLSGAVTLNTGSILAPGVSAGSIGTLTIGNDLSIGGDLAFDVNKSLSISNDLVIVSGVLTNTGTGTLTVSNLGPALAPGDRFILFSEPLQNGGALTLTGAGATWGNNLSGDGSITVIRVEPPELSFVRVGNNLRFSWNSIFGTYKLQVRTNGLNTGLGTNWSDYPGGATNPVIVPIDSTIATLFLRLVSTAGP